MGNLAVIDALANNAKTANPVRIGELVMAAPDIDQDHYRAALKDVSRIVGGMTLYASSADRTMVAARAVARAPRAGDVRGRPVLVDGTEAIDVTALGDEIFGLNHSTFASHRSLLNDVKLLIRAGVRPPHDRLTEIRMMPEGSPTPLYWRFVP
jgi:esterase/lipase superfamily enzyme